MGAEVVITGVRGRVAQTLVSLGVDLGAIVTRRNLQDGIDYAEGFNILDKALGRGRCHLSNQLERIHNGKPLPFQSIEPTSTI